MKRTITITDDQAERLLNLLGYKTGWVRLSDKELIDLIRRAPNHA